jgi:hypothetical protein
MQLHLFAVWFVNYNLVKYKIMIVILKIIIIIFHMPNVNYTKEMNSNEEIFQLEIKSKKFHHRESFHQERSLNTIPIVH